jgi:hypothetical protein
LKGEFFTPDYAISPSETSTATAYDPGNNTTTPAAVEFTTGSGGDKHYSYAMIAFRAGGNAGTGTPQPKAVNGNDAPRAAEWKQTLNSQAVIISDRNTGSGTSNTTVQSIHTDEAGEWRGSVLWGDNHVAFENEQYFETKYGNGALNKPNSGDADDLFTDSNVGTNSSGPRGSNAWMAIAGADTIASNETGN